MLLHGASHVPPDSGHCLCPDTVCETGRGSPTSCLRGPSVPGAGGVPDLEDSQDTLAPGWLERRGVGKRITSETTPGYILRTEQDVADRELESSDKQRELCEQKQKERKEEISMSQWSWLECAQGRG